ncbi:lysine (K)-specific demethylase 1B [Elysia marginata]|uniref:Lysine (K)-specific demethylase 1B n=1 Tax=Elysia marginata TaxID=1093978 RepID=A0AAV4H5S2_9GAST|nr:lysine (K)-specific demethylase 1B [Elysia marginata]
MTWQFLVFSVTFPPRSARTIKLNPKYFDVDFKSPKLDVAIKSEAVIDDIIVADVETSKPEGAESIETSLSPVATAVTVMAESPSARPARQIKPNSKYLDGIGMMSSPLVAKMEVKSEASDSATNSPGQKASPAARPARQIKLNPKYGDRLSSPLSAAKKECKDPVVPISSSGPALSGDKRETSRAKQRPAKQTKQVKCWDLESTDDENPKRPCERTSCPAVAPICFAGISDRCTGNKYTSRWYHISIGEHYCNNCFEYLRGRRGFDGDQDRGPQDYDAWRAVWSSKARSSPTLSGYLVDQVLPFWARCQTCGKWRQLPRGFQVSPDILRTFTCTVLAMSGTKMKVGDD